MAVGFDPSGYLLGGLNFFKFAALTRQALVLLLLFFFGGDFFTLYPNQPLKFIFFKIIQLFELF